MRSTGLLMSRPAARRRASHFGVARGFPARIKPSTVWPHTSCSSVLSPTTRILERLADQRKAVEHAPQLLGPGGRVGLDPERALEREELRHLSRAEARAEEARREPALLEPIDEHP